MKRRGLWTDLPTGYPVATLTEAGHDERLTATHDFTFEQARGSYCLQASYKIWLPGSTFSYDRSDILGRTASFNGVVHKIPLSNSLGTYVLVHFHYPRRARQPGKIMCKILCEDNIIGCTWRMTFIWLRKTSTNAPKKQASKNHPLQTIPESGRLDFVAMYILGPRPKALDANKVALVVTDSYSKLARALPTSNMSAPHVASFFMDNYTIPYGILCICWQITKHILEVSSSFLGSKHQMTIACHRITGRLKSSTRRQSPN